MPDWKRVRFSNIKDEVFPEGDIVFKDVCLEDGSPIVFKDELVIRVGRRFLIVEP